MNGQEVVKRFESLKTHARQNWMQLWQECADWAMPTNDNINQIHIGGTEKPPQRMIDTCIEANYAFAAGFFANMFPPNVVWAKFRHPDAEMMANQDVADYFESVSKIIHELLLASNFSQEEFQALLSLGCFGTNCVSIDEDPKTTFRFRSFIVSKIVMDENHAGAIDTVGRELTLDARQAIQKFGRDALAKAEMGAILADEQADKKYTFIHMVTPRSDYDTKSKAKTEKPYASVYVSKDSKKIIEEGGFDYNPYNVGRFTTGNDEIYGRSPMSMVLATARRTNVIFRSLVVSAEQHANPQWLVPDDDSVKGLSGRAGAKIKWRSSNPNGRPERLAPNGDPQIASTMFEAHEDQIKRMFFNHLFRPLDDYRNMSAFEASVREQTDMLSLSAFVSRYLDEHVSPMMEVVFRLAGEAGKLPAVPEILREANDYEIDYIGRLSMAAKGTEARGTVDTLRVMAELSQGVPQLAESFDYIDGDKLLKILNYSNSGSMRVLKDAKVVESERQQRAEAQAQQEQMANAPAMADAAQKVSGAVDPTSLLAQMGGQQ